ncbi:hypothetical protein FGG08_003964 [Glutinoglossum americanum]|uniref:DUF4440 domain-containing protein n=1 Tax=Glutinoglossum americanum TaxID=1670608 RepID=A0A9P8KXJ6_9PEZI|nr:hypothetical protein FGG08_003964 [Glutinoglossum americanum]
MNTISERIKSTITDLEHQTWRALPLLPYLSTDCVLLLHDHQMLDSATSPSLAQHLTSPSFRPWASYSMYDVKVVEVDMMAAVICYGIRVEERLGRKLRAYEGVASSTWRQDAGGDWKMCVHQQSFD